MNIPSASTMAHRIVIALSLVGAACASPLAVAHPESATFAAERLSLEATSVADLERQFWICDHRAARTGTDLDEGAYCYLVSDALKRVRFDGDFKPMLNWWLAHRERMHALLDEMVNSTALAVTDFDAP